MSELEHLPPGEVTKTITCPVCDEIAGYANGLLEKGLAHPAAMLTIHNPVLKCIRCGLVHEVILL